LNGDYENIDYYYNDITIKQSDKLIKSLKKSNKGLTVIHGKRGSGKTSLVNYIISEIDKISIFIPNNMFEITINNPEFKNLIKRYRNSILILDDSEVYLSDLNTKSNLFISNLLQLIDGFQSDNLSLHVICIANIENLDEIDETILECNNLIDVISIEDLKTEKVQELLNLKKSN
jgi:ABC-type lipoprotein export system ATPase subunit